MTAHYIGSAGPSEDNATSNYDIFDPPLSENGPIGIGGLFSPYWRKSTAPLPFYSPTRAYGFRDILDGASNSLALGESARSETSGFVPHRVGWAFGAEGIIQIVDGKKVYVPIEIYAVTSVGLDPINANRDYMEELDFRNSHCFNSNHPGGAQFSMADGSVRFVNEGTDITVLRQLSSIAGREIIPEF